MSRHSKSLSPYGASNAEKLVTSCPPPLPCAPINNEMAASPFVGLSTNIHDVSFDTDMDYDPFGYIPLLQSLSSDPAIHNARAQPQSYEALLAMHQKIMTMSAELFQQTGATLGLHSYEYNMLIRLIGIHRDCLAIERTHSGTENARLEYMRALIDVVAKPHQALMHAWHNFIVLLDRFIFELGLHGIISKCHLSQTQQQ